MRFILRAHAADTYLLFSNCASHNKATKQFTKENKHGFVLGGARRGRSKRSAHLSRVRQRLRAGSQAPAIGASRSVTLAGQWMAGGVRAARQAQPERRDGIAIHRHHPSQKKAAPDERPLLPARTALHRVDSGYSARSNLFLVSQALFFDCLRIATSAGQIQ